MDAQQYIGVVNLTKNHPLKYNQSPPSPYGFQTITQFPSNTPYNPNLNHKRKEGHENISHQGTSTLLREVVDYQCMPA